MLSIKYGRGIIYQTYSKKSNVLWSYFYFLLTVVSEIIMNYACTIHTYEDQALAFELFFILDMKRVMVTTTMRWLLKTHYQYEGTFLD